jgi:UDP:flavonoid glycosyltransferase YjiC (YdhE family)
MRVLAVAFAASGGDFHPLVATALGLRDRGHEVALFCDAKGAELVASTGLRTIVVDDAWVAVRRAHDKLRPRLQALSAEEQLRLLPTWMTTRAEALLPAFLDAMRRLRTDVVVAATMAAPVACDAARQRGVPWCFVNSTYDLARTPDTALGGWIAPIMAEAALVLHATDAVFDGAASLPDQQYVGPLMWEPATPVPPYLLEEGPPWALVTVSLLPQGDIALVPLALKTLSHLGLRAVATIGEGNDPDAVGPLPTGAYLARSLSHAVVLERAQLLVGHAGHGSVSKALWYGVPMVLVPWGRDQPGVAMRAERLGIARVVRPEDLASLPEAIRDVVTTDRYRRAAKAHAARVQKLNPLMLACDLIETRFGHAPKNPA